MGLFDKEKKEDDVKHVLEVLSLNVESINKRLEQNEENGLPDEIIDNINSILSMQKYIYSSIHKMSSSINNIESKLEKQEKKIDELRQVTAGIQKNEAVHKRLDEMVERFNTLFKILSEEVRIIKGQNLILQKMLK